MSPSTDRYRPSPTPTLFYPSRSFAESTTEIHCIRKPFNHGEHGGTPTNHVSEPIPSGKENLQAQKVLVFPVCPVPPVVNRFSHIHLNFNVESPINTKIMVIIQNRTTTC